MSSAIAKGRIRHEDEGTSLDPDICVANENEAKWRPRAADRRGRTALGHRCRLRNSSVWAWALHPAPRSLSTTEINLPTSVSISRFNTRHNRYNLRGRGALSMPIEE
ncbi:unnamed protein product [Chrysodeixis includens]|uniref:Uncharacterized protein n=1 Tax=Chrysodeixis includens TaxID=689277 RepID=A0A9N8KT90_CHRIL|nr:unnamed protein product [Chrysodeixis includens]